MRLALFAFFVTVAALGSFANYASAVDCKWTSHGEAIGNGSPDSGTAQEQFVLQATYNLQCGSTYEPVSGNYPDGGGLWTTAPTTANRQSSDVAASRSPIGRCATTALRPKIDSHRSSLQCAKSFWRRTAYKQMKRRSQF